MSKVCWHVLSPGAEIIQYSDIILIAVQREETRLYNVYNVFAPNFHYVI